MKVRNLTVKLMKFSLTLMSYMRKLKKSVGLIAAAVMLVSAPLLAEEEYYTWVDENGVTNYSERNPQGYSAEYITKESRFGYQFQPRDSSAPAAPNQDVEEEASPEDQEIDAQIAEERARVNQDIAAAKSSNCQIGKRNLAQLEAYSRIKVKGDDGKERVLTDSEKAERIAKAKKTIRDNCTG